MECGFCSTIGSVRLRGVRGGSLYISSGHSLSISSRISSETADTPQMGGALEVPHRA